MSRNKSDTKQLILDATQALLKEEGLSGLGVNAIARKAGVGKPLIYRYFTDIDGVLKALLKRMDASRVPGARIGGVGGQREGQAGAEDRGRDLILSGRALAQDQLAADMLLVALAQRLPGVDSGVVDDASSASAPEEEMDWVAVEALMRAAISFIILYRRHNKTWAGLSLERPKDMARLENAMLAMMTGVANAP